MSEDLESRFKKLQERRKELEERIRNLPITLKQLELYMKLKVDNELTSLVTIKTKEDYYSQTYQKRAAILNVPKRNTFYLCKTIVMRNKAYKEELQ